MNMIRTSFKYDNNIICIDEDISKNTITIDGIDYFAYYINPEFKKNPMYLLCIKLKVSLIMRVLLLTGLLKYLIKKTMHLLYPKAIDVSIEK